MINISKDKSKLDIDMLFNFLSQSYWAKERTKSQVKMSIENSICFGIYQNSDQIGFARVITDYVTFAYICDLFVLESYRGKGFAQKLMTAILSDDSIQEVKSWYLITKDAQDLYSKYGFTEFVNNEKVIMSNSKQISYE